VQVFPIATALAHIDFLRHWRKRKKSWIMELSASMTKIHPMQKGMDFLCLFIISPQYAQHIANAGSKGDHPPWQGFLGDSVP